jgi:hypothetical protein
MIHEYNMKIEAKTESEATEKMKALTVLASKLSANELSGLANVVKNDPIKTAIAKKYMGL